MKKISILIVALLTLSLTTNVSATPPPPIPQGFDIYREPITTPQHLDWLWQDYLLRGKIEAIEKITTALRLNSYSGALEKAKGMQSKRDITEEEKKAAYLDAVFQSAMWSLESNAKQHSPVLAELKRIESATRHNSDISHAYLLIILSKTAPNEFKMISNGNGMNFLTPNGEVRFSVKK